MQVRDDSSLKHDITMKLNGYRVYVLESEPTGFLDSLDLGI